LFPKQTGACRLAVGAAPKSNPIARFSFLVQQIGRHAERRWRDRFGFFESSAP